MADRQRLLLTLIEQAMGKTAYIGPDEEEGEDLEADDDTIEAVLTIPPAADDGLRASQEEEQNGIRRAA